jgi:hypothetical protein
MNLEDVIEIDNERENLYLQFFCDLRIPFQPSFHCGRK